MPNRKIKHNLSGKSWQNPSVIKQKNIQANFRKEKPLKCIQVMVWKKHVKELSVLRGHFYHMGPVLSNYCPIIPLMTLTYSPCGVTCEVRSKKSSAETLTRPGGEGASKPQKITVCPSPDIRVHNTGLISMSQKDRGLKNQPVQVIRPQSPTPSELRGMWGSQSLCPTNRSFSFPG